MSTTHEILKNVVGRNIDANAATRKLATYLVQRGIPNISRIVTDYTGGATTTPVEATALTITNGVGFNGGTAVVGGRAYKFRAWLPSTVNGTSGATVTCSGGTATFSSFAATGYAYTASAIATVVTSAAATAVVDAAAAYTSIVIEGSFVASAAGSFGLKLGTHASTTAPKFLAGGYLELVEVPVSETP